MKVKKAWTLAELTICVLVLFILVGAGASIMKPNNNKIRLYAYAAMKNLMTANSSIIASEGDTFLQTEMIDTDADGVLDVCPTAEKYCSKVADLFTIAGAANCGTVVATATTCDVTPAIGANFTLVNGVQYFGLDRAWQATGSYHFKDILIDIDGDGNGFDRLWVDKFPLRVYSRDQRETLRTVSCNPSSLSDGVRHADCGGSTNVDFRRNAEVFKYQIYRVVTDAAGNSKGVLTATGLSEFDANCQAGTGIFSSSAGCNGMRRSECSATPSPCFVVLQKPNAGAGLILDSIIGDMDF